MFETLRLAEISSLNGLLRTPVFLLVPAVLLVLSACATASPGPPATRVEAVTEVLHGVAVTDPYRWLEDQESAETRAWIETQNRYTSALLDPLPARGELVERFAALSRVDLRTAPLERAGRYFFQLRARGEERYVIAMRRGLGGGDEVLVDARTLSADAALSVELIDAAADGRTLLYNTRQGGEDEISLALLDVEGRVTRERLPRALYQSVALAPDGKTIYYVKQSAAGPRIFRHGAGSAVEADRELFGAGYGPEKIIGLNLSDDGRYLLATVYYGASVDRSDLFLADLGGDGAFETVVEGVEAVFEGQVAGGKLFIRTNWQAPGGRLLATEVGNLARESWREIVAERPDAAIESFAALAGRLLVFYIWQVRSQVVAYTPEGSRLGELDFGPPGTLVSARGRWESPELFFGFSSLHLPTTIYRFDAATGERTVWARPELPFDASAIEVEQVWYNSKDGTRVPMFLVHKKGLKLDGGNPTLLSGYGGFNVSLTPAFSPTIAVWVERGGVYAQPNLRGGGEFGEAWHRAGMLDKKQNVFDDFYAAAEWLIREGYTRPSKLAASGGSNGGLLMGALATQRPELARAILCTYPLLDMVRYHRFLVARYWIPEYGSAEDPEQFEVLHAYSPYHHVRPGVTYPAMLFVTGDGDTRVAPLHARKMAALMQAVARPEVPVLLRYHTTAGHAGAEPVSQQVEHQAEALSFLFWQLGVRE